MILWGQSKVLVVEEVVKQANFSGENEYTTHAKNHTFFFVLKDCFLLKMINDK